MRWPFVLALAANLACGADLGRRDAEPDPFDPVFDPQLVALDRSAPFTRFDGGPGSILLGEGWAPPQESRPRGELVPIAWALGEEAALWLERPPEGPVDFLGSCMPFTFRGSPQQTLTLACGEREIDTRALEEGWQEVRIPIPSDALEAGLNELRLSFAYAREASDVLPDSEDRRRLAVACEWLAVVPRAVHRFESSRRAAELDRDRRRLRLAPESRAAFPLPAGSEVAVNLGPVRGTCGRCRLRVELVSQNGREEIWQGEAASASGLALGFRTPDGAPSRLGLELEAAGGEAADGRAVDIRLPAEFLETRRPPGEPSAERPHVFIYLVDTLRADALAPYGGKPEASPRIAEFARDAVVYRNAWTASSWTLPSVVSLLTGSYPFRHRVMQGDVKLTADNVPSLPGLLGIAGYDAIGISQSYVASSRFGIDTGFSRFFLSNQLNGRQLRSQEVRRYLLASLLWRPRPERPIFAYLHTVAPHAPYTPRGEDRRFADHAPGALADDEYRPTYFMQEGFGDDPREVAHLRGLYEGEVAYADREFGRFIAMLDYLDLYDDSLIVFLSDHGEEFGEHSGFGHGRTLYEEMLRSPLIVKYPRSRWAGRVIADRVSTVDLAPTILRAAGIETEVPTFDGTTIRPPDLDERPPGRQVIFAEVHPTRSPLLASVDYRALVVDDLKCIESLSGNDQFGRPIPRWQTFDLGRDPGEREPLPADAESAQRCRGLMERWLAARQRERSEGLPAVDDEALEQLRALGYIE